MTNKLDVEILALAPLGLGFELSTAMSSPNTLANQLIWA